jgi:hypothetical protein
MARRPALLIGLLLAVFCLLLPACRQVPRTNLSLSQPAGISRNLTVAVYRFRSGAVPFCEMYFQFTSQRERPYLVKAISACGEQLATLRGCQRHATGSIRSRHQDDVWERIDDTAQPSGDYSCRYHDRSVVL